MSELEKRLEAIEKDIARLKARDEISNLMSKYMYYHTSFRDDLILEECWALDREDITLEDGASGVYVGSTHIKDYYCDRPNPPGKFIFHSIHTPVIEVAEDGKTAKGVWMLSGCESGMVPENKKELPDAMFCKETLDGKKIWAHWCWAKYGVDFICENGAWKIWHFHCYALTRTSFDENWVAFAAKAAKAAASQPENPDAPKTPLRFIGNDGEAFFMAPPDRPTTFHWNYDGMTSTSVLQPVPPKPYKTFDDTFPY